jgi:hypothetical protein
MRPATCIARSLRRRSEPADLNGINLCRTDSIGGRERNGPMRTMLREFRYRTHERSRKEVP